MCEILLTTQVADISFGFNGRNYNLSQISGHELDPRDPVGFVLKRFIKTASTSKRGIVLPQGRLHQDFMPLAERCMSGLNWGERPNIQGTLLNAIMKTLKDKGIDLPEEAVVCAAAIPAATFYAAVDACNETYSDTNHKLPEGVILGIAMAERLNQLTSWPSVKAPRTKIITDLVTGDEVCMPIEEIRLGGNGFEKIPTYKSIKVNSFSEFLDAVTDSLRIRNNIAAGKGQQQRGSLAIQAMQP